MLKTLRQLCGKIVAKLRIQYGISCESVSTYITHSAIETPTYANNPPLTHYFYPHISHHLSPSIYFNLPLMNTIFTQFPQRLLLLQLNKI